MRSISGKGFFEKVLFSLATVYIIFAAAGHLCGEFLVGSDQLKVHCSLITGNNEINYESCSVHEISFGADRQGSNSQHTLFENDEEDEVVSLKRNGLKRPLITWFYYSSVSPVENSEHHEEGSEDQMPQFCVTGRYKLIQVFRI